jgi:hypothetical protein
MTEMQPVCFRERPFLRNAGRAVYGLRGLSCVRKIRFRKKGPRIICEFIFRITGTGCPIVAGFQLERSAPLKAGY